MTREEAINTVRNIYQTDKEKEALATLIPELAESEEERIRKIITDSVFYQYGAGVEYKDVLDYLDKLEKQKEQNLIMANSPQLKEQKQEKFPPYVTGFKGHPDPAGTSDLEEAAKGYASKTLCDPDDGPSTGLAKESFIAGAEWQKEQKPAEWSEEDEEILKLLILNIGRYKYFGGMSSERILAFLKSLRPHLSDEEIKKIRSEEYTNGFNDCLLGKQKEWSEEDEEMFEAFMHKLEVCDLLTNKEIMWAKLRLKSLYPHPKQEWSEEEKEILDSILSHYVLIDKPIDANGIPKEKYISLIKSIRFDTYKNCNIHWKPSEEQMKALHWSINLEVGRKDIIREGCMGIKGPMCDPGRRGRMGGVPKEISKEAEAFQAKFPGPYNEDDIITAYETAKMKAIEDLPKWKEVKTCGKGECTIGSAFEATGRRYPILYCYGYGISIEQLFEKLPKKED